MTRRPKTGSKSGGPGAGNPHAHANKTASSKTPAGKPRASKPPFAKTSVTDPPVHRKPPVARSGGANADVPNGGQADSPSSNGHGKAQAAQPGGPSGNISRKANRRGAARLAAVQALYQMDMTGAGLNEILAQFESHWLGREVEGEQYLPAEAAFFRDIVSGVVDVQRDLDPRIDAALEATWPLKRIEAILRSVLRAGAYELQKRTDVPARVVVSEYVDVAHAFVDKIETGMVNAVLDRLARNARAAEFGG